MWEDGTTLPLHRDPDKSAAAIAQILGQGRRDVPRDVAARRAEWLPMIQASLYTPPMPVGAQAAMMDQSAEGREIMRAIGRYPPST